MLKWEWKMSRALVCIKYLIFSQWEVSGKGPYNKYYKRQFHHWTRLLMTSFALTETLQMQPLRFCGPNKQPHSSWKANSCFCNAEEWVGAVIVSSFSLSPPLHISGAFRKNFEWHERYLWQLCDFGRKTDNFVKLPGKHELKKMFPFLRGESASHLLP